MNIYSLIPAEHATSRLATARVIPRFPHREAGHQGRRTPTGPGHPRRLDKGLSKRRKSRLHVEKGVGSLRAAGERQ
jgi:hypothetical protein